MAVVDRDSLYRLKKKKKKKRNARPFLEHLLGPCTVLDAARYFCRLRPPLSSFGLGICFRLYLPSPGIEPGPCGAESFLRERGSG